MWVCTLTEAGNALLKVPCPSLLFFIIITFNLKKPILASFRVDNMHLTLIFFLLILIKRKELIILRLITKFPID